MDKLHGVGPEPARLVLACGDLLEARVEDARDVDKVDHVWITMDCGTGERVMVSINTTSRKSAVAGFDGRLRIGRVAGRGLHLPPRGLRPLDRFDYADVEAENNVYYEHHDREACESLLLGLAAGAERLEAWGAPYRRHRQTGLHQVHSRRTSCAVVDDLNGSDGGLKFYRREVQDVAWTLVMIKFCGQP